MTDEHLASMRVVQFLTVILTAVLFFTGETSTAGETSPIHRICAGAEGCAKRSAPVAVPVQARTQVNPPHINDRVWIPQMYGPLKFRVLFPDNFDTTKRYPLVVFLHGSGESGDDNVEQIRNGVELFATSKYKKMFPAIVIAPQCPENDTWGGYLYHNRPTPSQNLVVSLTQVLLMQLPVDINRVYLTGVSMGAIGTWDIVARYPGLFAAALPIAGAGDPANSRALQRLPICSFHGDQDLNVDPVDDRNMFALIQSAGGIMKYTEYPGVGHNAWDQTYSDTTVISWLFSQSAQSNLGQTR